MADLPDTGFIQIPTNRSKNMRRYATVAKIGSYVAPALATVFLFFAKSDAAWFWWAAAALLVSIALQAAKDWWERVIRGRRSADLREIELATAQFAMSAIPSMRNEGLVAKAVDMSRYLILMALGREFGEWDGTRVTLIELMGEDRVKSYLSLQVGEDLKHFDSEEAFRARLDIVAALLEGYGRPFLVKPGDQAEDFIFGDARLFVPATARTGTYIATFVRLGSERFAVILLQVSLSETLSERDVSIVETYADRLALTYAVGAPGTD